MIRLPQPTLPRRDWSVYPHIPAPVVVLGDLHVPYHDTEWIERVLERAHRMGIYRVLLAGDVMDVRHLSVFASGDVEHAFEAELEAARELVRVLSEHFEVHVFPGNHDHRFSKKLERHMGIATLWRYAFGPEVHIYEHHHALVGGGWAVLHPGNYSRTPAQPAYDLAAKLGRHVAIAHTHKWALTRDRSGTRWVAEIGMCAHSRWFEYIHREIRTGPPPQQGALIIDADERPHLLHPELV